MENQRPLLPAGTRGALLPYGDADGAVIPHAGRYARECVMIAFEMIGGVEAMADWAGKNKDLFYTRMYTKIMTKEVEIHASEGIEDLLARLDAAPRRDHSHEVMDAEVVED